MPDLVKYIREIANEIPEVKEMLEKEDKYIEERFNHHLTEGLEAEEAHMKAWSDFWKMANERDGVEFSIRRLDVEE